MPWSAASGRRCPQSDRRRSERMKKARTFSMTSASGRFIVMDGSDRGRGATGLETVERGGGVGQGIGHDFVMLGGPGILGIREPDQLRGESASGARFQV